MNSNSKKKDNFTLHLYYYCPPALPPNIFEDSRHAGDDIIKYSPVVICHFSSPDKCMSVLLGLCEVDWWVVVSQVYTWVRLFMPHWQIHHYTSWWQTSLTFWDPLGAEIQSDCNTRRSIKKKWDILSSNLCMYACVFAHMYMTVCVCVCAWMHVSLRMCVCYVKVASQLSPRSALGLLSSPHNLTKTLISPPMMDAYGFLHC